VPVEPTEQALRDTMAVARGVDRKGARAALSALEWMGWEGEGPLLLRRYDVQLFVWYTLPRKFPGFRAACAELAAARILTGVAVDYSDALAKRIQPAIVAGGWQSSGEPPGVRDVGWGIADFLRPAEAVGLLERREGSSRFSRDPLVLTEAGRAALIAGLRARALAPGSGAW
jgi:hypothetical protein